MFVVFELKLHSTGIPKTLFLIVAILNLQQFALQPPKLLPPAWHTLPQSAPCTPRQLAKLGPREGRLPLIMSQGLAACNLLVQAVSTHMLLELFLLPNNGWGGGGVGQDIA